jgi:hypothetical protein
VKWRRASLPASTAASCRPAGSRVTGSHDGCLYIRRSGAHTVRTGKAPNTGSSRGRTNCLADSPHYRRGSGLADILVAQRDRDLSVVWQSLRSSVFPSKCRCCFQAKWVPSFALLDPFAARRSEDDRYPLASTSELPRRFEVLLKDQSVWATVSVSHSSESWRVPGFKAELDYNHQRIFVPGGLSSCRQQFSSCSRRRVGAGVVWTFVGRSLRIVSRNFCGSRNKQAFRVRNVFMVFLLICGGSCGEEVLRGRPLSSAMGSFLSAQS